MKNVIILSCILSLIVLFAALSDAQPAAEPAISPSIRGSYVLDYRELPDGKEVRSPEVIGMLTYTADQRNFNVYWQEDGKPVSICSVSRYSLDDKQYAEENIYYMMNDEAHGKGVTYDINSERKTSPITMNAGKIEFQLPLHGEPKVVFDSEGFTATREGAFVDHWKKIE